MRCRPARRSCRAALERGAGAGGTAQRAGLPRHGGCHRADHGRAGRLPAQPRTSRSSPDRRPGQGLGRVQRRLRLPGRRPRLRPVLAALAGPDHRPGGRRRDGLDPPPAPPTPPSPPPSPPLPSPRPGPGRSATGPTCSPRPPGPTPTPSCSPPPPRAPNWPTWPGWPMRCGVARLRPMKTATTTDPAARSGSTCTTAATASSAATSPRAAPPPSRPFSTPSARNAGPRTPARRRSATTTPSKKPAAA